MTLFFWLYVTGFAITAGHMVQRDIHILARELLEIPDDLPEWALPFVLLIVAFVMWPFFLGNIKR